MKLVIILTRIWKQFAMATILKFHMTIITVISTWLAFQIFIFLINPTNDNYKEKSSIHYNPIKYALYNQRNYQQTARLDNALQWHHNDHEGVSNHKPHDFLLHFFYRLFRCRSKKHQSSASLAFVRGIHRWPVNSPHKGPVTRKMSPFVIMSSALHVREAYPWKCHQFYRGYLANPSEIQLKPKFREIAFLKTNAATVEYFTEHGKI